LRKHARAALSVDHSYAGEAAHLRGLLVRCGISSGFVVDLAAGDGVTQSSTLFLFRDETWRGLAVEMDSTRFQRLAFAYRSLPNAGVLQRKITPDGVEGLLASQGVPMDFEVLNLDLDSYDLEVAAAILRSFRPLVISMEVNEKVPPPVYFAVLYDPTHVWLEDHFYGCSIVAAAELFKARGYVLESLQYNNAFFVRGDLATGTIQDEPVAEAYARGYRNRPDRRELFPWNHDMEVLHQLEPLAVLEVLRERFKRYEGKFIAEVRSTGG
jgi:hypothetical protein